MKAFTFRGLLLTGFATHTLTWIHLHLSVFLNVFLEMSEDFVDVALPAGQKCIFKSFGKSKTNFFSLFQEGLKESKRSFYK